MPTINEIKKALETLSQSDLESYYVNRILPFDKRSMTEIVKGH